LPSLAQAEGAVGRLLFFRPGLRDRGGHRGFTSSASGPVVLGSVTTLSARTDKTIEFSERIES
jgi:hypothetical protein